MTQPEKKVYSVSEITDEIKGLLEYNLENVCLTGEISNFRVPASGHYYFTLKDENAQIKAVMFRQTNMYLRFLPKDGMQVLGTGRIGVYAPRGTYQIILDYMEPTGIGALKQAYEDLKNRLMHEGLFDEELKRPLPMLVKSVGVVTSPTGAAIRDFISVAKRRSVNVNIVIYPARVQGTGAAEEIAEGIKYFNESHDVDAIVITRGGGSFEDMFCFSEEVVVRAVARSEIPVISAVGHEIDSSISDFVADLRAPTPSSAAELIFAKKDELEYRVVSCVERLSRAAGYYFDEKERRVEYCSRIVTQPRRRLDDLAMRIDDISSYLINVTKSGLRDYQSRVSIAGDRLDHANPYNLLKKGYSIVSAKDTKKIVRSVKEVKEGELLDIKLSVGSIECEVTKTDEE